MQTPFETEIAQLLIQALDLEDISPADITPDAPLFGFGEPDSLGLDSIDALEIALSLGKTYGVQLKADDEHNKETFRSLRSLAAYVSAHRA
ncbi:MAG TPA: phosphopantetheine-binding protein [Cellvibrionaceae bacterium]|nr:phosphopantetheine-binding protein [Cellvibrionaceae bacterium]